MTTGSDHHSLPQRPRLRHERPAPSERASQRERQLHAAVVSRASSVAEQLLILRVEAGRTGASERDVRAVRERLLEGHVRECGTDWSVRG